MAFKEQISLKKGGLRALYILYIKKHGHNEYEDWMFPYAVKTCLARFHV
jgi:hypothetical protein